ncbi:MAG: transporter substrate-binding domain-containing protein, partial [Methanocorpusculum sp.]|nr:transporter substrate-binding domain-containing protein [Methanocorpusculum sp.]
YSGMTVTNERLNWVTFSDPYLAGRMVVLCPSSKIVTDETFESGNAVVGAQRGTTNEDWLISFFGKNKYKSMLENGKIVLVENQDEMYKAMKNGKIDCVVVDEVGHKEIMSERNLA